MWWMGVFYGVYLVVRCRSRCGASSRATGTIHRYACILLLDHRRSLAPTTLGAVFAVLAARPYWHGAFTPPAMVTMAVLSGTALLGIVFCAVFRYRLAGWERAATLAIPAIRLLLDDRARGLRARRRLADPVGHVRGDPRPLRREPGRLRRAARAPVLGRPRRARARSCRWHFSCTRGRGRRRASSGRACLIFVGIFADRLHLRERRPDRPRHGRRRRGLRPRTPSTCRRSSRSRSSSAPSGSSASSTRSPSGGCRWTSTSATGPAASSRRPTARRRWSRSASPGSRTRRRSRSCTRTTR